MLKIFKNKKITIMGLGLHGGGVGVAKFFCEQGADVLVTDLKTKEQLKESLLKLKKCKIRYRLGEHKEEDFIHTDFVIKNPAVPQNSSHLKIAKDNGVKIETDINLFFKLCKTPIVGITGTKGKSTIATLIYEFLKTKYKNAVLAGNIGVSPLEYLGKIHPIKCRYAAISPKAKLFNRVKKDSKGLPPHHPARSGSGSGWVVLELSSFELEDLKKSPAVALASNILPDHLNRYRGMKDYIKAKKLIFKYQKPSDFLILNYDDQIVRNFSKEARSKVFFFASREKQNGCWLQGKEIFFGDELVCSISDFKLSGEHNISNILAALTVAKILGVNNERIKKVAAKFKGVASRQELVAIKKGVKYINDTTATMPGAVIQALRTLRDEGRIILVAGGQDKGLEYKEMAKAIIKTVHKIVLLPGTASEKIKKELSNLKSVIEIIPADSMQEAIKKSSQIAEKKDIVLLSPGATSFNLFKNEFDRGEQFNKAVSKLKK